MRLKCSGAVVRSARPAMVALVTMGAVALAAPAQSHAQKRDVVRRLVEYGRMDRRQARRLVREVTSVLQANAGRGGESYDRIRKAVNRAVYRDKAGPGETREEYFARLERVLGAMRQGLDDALLEQLFASGDDAAADCARDFGITVGQCDALLAAASKQSAGVPYAPPNDGSALRRRLRRAEGVSGRQARIIVERLKKGMLSVPGSLTEDERGRGLGALLQACPGGLGSREAQLRAWHVGPTVGMAECVARELSKGGERRAVRRLGDWFEMPAAAARAFVSWAAAASKDGAAGPADRKPSFGSQPPSPPDSSPEQSGKSIAIEQLRQQARRHYRAGRFGQAAASYEAALSIDGSDPRSWAGLGASRLSMRRPAAAAEAYARSVDLMPEHADYRVALARAHAQAGSKRAAIRELHGALRLEPDNDGARRGLTALGASPDDAAQTSPAPSTRGTNRAAAARNARSMPARARGDGQLPRTPSRQAIIQVMRPLEGALRSCAPSHEGQVVFRLRIRGDSGEIASARVGGELADTRQAKCMAGVVRSVTFPRFQKKTLEISYPYQL